MNIKLVVTKTCSHCHNIEKELNDLGVVFEKKFVEDNGELVKKYNIRHSPNIIVDDEVVCRNQPTEGELKTLLGLA